MSKNSRVRDHGYISSQVPIVTATQNEPTLSVEYLVIAGGGGADTVRGGGAGAGGYRTNVLGETSGRNSVAEASLLLIFNTAYTVTIGAGGAGAGGGTYTAPNAGNNSVFATITSQGGATSSGSIKIGGCGGGADGNSNGRVGSGISGQGFNGGAGANYGAGGGGGAGAVGGNATASVAGNGGAGITSSITGSPVTRGGGGGGGHQANLGGTRGTGGSGGGGNGGLDGSTVATSGAVDTGGGGGGGRGDGANYFAGGAGGSGVVILRWLTSAGTITVGAGLTADATTTSGLYSIKRITAGSGNVSWA